MDPKEIAQLITEDPDIFSQIHIGHKIIVTVPHATPSNGGDDGSAIFASEIVKRLKNRSIQHKVFFSNTARSEKDLNRPGARNMKWRKAIRKALEPGSILIDVHSYSERDLIPETWRNADCVVYSNPKIHNELFVQKFIDNLHKKGIIAITELGSNRNDIVMDASKSEAYGFLFELNDASIDKASIIANAIVDVLSSLKL